MKKVINLRAHHLLCTVLYKGAGYSKDFTENMDGIVKALREGSLIKLRCTQDIICSECPNALNDGRCALDKKEAEYKEIKTLDSKVVEYFGLEDNLTEMCQSEKIFASVKNRINKEVFDEFCGNCRWYKAGYCSYEEYTDRVDLFINTNNTNM